MLQFYLFCICIFIDLDLNMYIYLYILYSCEYIQYAHKHDQQIFVQQPTPFRHSMCVPFAIFSLEESNTKHCLAQPATLHGGLSTRGVS